MLSPSKFAHYIYYDIAIRYLYTTDSGITPSGFTQFDEKDFDDIRLTTLGKKLFLKIFTEIKGIVNLSWYIHDKKRLTVKHAKC